MKAKMIGAIIGLVVGIAGAIQTIFFAEGIQGFATFACGYLIGMSLIDLTTN